MNWFWLGALMDYLPDRRVQPPFHLSHLAGVRHHGEGVDVEARGDDAQQNGVGASCEPARSFAVPVSQKTQCVGRGIVAFWCRDENRHWGKEARMNRGGNRKS